MIENSEHETSMVVDDCGLEEMEWQPLEISKESYDKLRQQVWSKWPYFYGIGADGRPLIFVPIWTGISVSERQKILNEARTLYQPNCCKPFDPNTRTCPDEDRPVPQQSGWFYHAYLKLNNTTWLPKFTKQKCR